MPTDRLGRVGLHEMARLANPHEAEMWRPLIESLGDFRDEHRILLTPDEE